MDRLIPCLIDNNIRTLERFYLLLKNSNLQQRSLSCWPPPKDIILPLKLLFIAAFKSVTGLLY